MIQNLLCDLCYRICSNEMEGETNICSKWCEMMGPYCEDGGTHDNLDLYCWSNCSKEDEMTGPCYEESGTHKGLDLWLVASVDFRLD